MSDIIINDNTEAVKGLILEALENGLEKVGMVAESYAKDKCPVDTGALRNSITHKVDPGERCVYIGTNMEYGPYVELGTGQYVAGGRPGSWVYQDASGNWHRTSGQPPRPFLKPAAADHLSEYAAILRSELE